MLLSLQESYEQSLALLHQTGERLSAKAATESTPQVIAAREGILTGLAALLSGEKALIGSFRKTLRSLATQQAEMGQIPATITYDGPRAAPDYGSRSGQVDTVPWFIIGVCNFVHLQNDLRFLDEMLPHIHKGLNLMESWEFNNRGLMYVPQAGDWADEYVLHGYVLYDQLLRLWALRCVAALTEDQKLRLKAEYLEEIITVNYWPDAEHPGSRLVYHEAACQRLLDKKGQVHYWQAGFRPGGYDDRLDAWGNALAVLLQVGSHHKQHQVINYLDQIGSSLPLQLVPQFYPPIQKFERGWDELQENRKGDFRNHPHEHHNGGTWPLINAFAGMAYIAGGEQGKASRLLASLGEACRGEHKGEEWAFAQSYNSQTGKPCGPGRQAMSAAAIVLLQKHLEGKSLWLGE